MVDWDEDGDKDLLVGEYDGHVHYFENIGTPSVPNLRNNGHLQAGGVDIDVSQLAIPVVNDWDEDGDKDLIVGNDVADIKIFINTGTNSNPILSPSVLLQANPPISQIKNGPDIGDLNGDGLKDLAYGWWQGTIYFYPNSGTNAAPVYNEVHLLTALGDTIQPNFPTSGWTHLELNDWDEDGDLDLVYGEWTGQVNIYLNVTDDLEMTLTPINPPIIIPSGGGSFSYNAAITNNTTYSVSANVWAAAVLPSGQVTIPLFLVTVTLPVGGNLTRTRTQTVPGSAPPGNYTYFLRWGIAPDNIWAEASFPFSKSGAGVAGAGGGEWTNTGDSFAPGETDAFPVVSALLGNYPNPFNPETVIRFALPEASLVKLDIFDPAGRMVQSLINGWRGAGAHEVTFDGGGLPSGIYLARLTAGEFTVARKLVLMK
jgi:hypothetical protein